MAIHKSVKDLEKKWYNILKKKGFKDIEDTSKLWRPLKHWEGFLECGINQKTEVIRATRVKYQEQIETFRHNPEFDQVCKNMVSHGNCRFTRPQVILIWELHIEGATTRAIAKKLGRTKSRIDGIIDGLRQWMKLL